MNTHTIAAPIGLESGRCFEPFVQQLSHQNWAIVDHFLRPEQCQSLRERIDHLQKEGALHAAGIGKLQDFELNREVRRDQIFWLDQQPDHPVSQEVVQLIDELRLYVNRSCFLGLKGFESHLTSYPPGSFYKRHRDRFRHLSHRVLSLVIYLNENWKTSDGGQLLIYENDETITVEPINGRAVLFASELEHEVLLSHANRYSVTCWMLDTLPGTTFL